MSSEEPTHWCFHCDVPVWARDENPICPYCQGGFVQRVHESAAYTPHSETGPSEIRPSEPDPGPISTFLGSLASLVSPAIAMAGGRRARPHMSGPRRVIVGPIPHYPVPIYPIHPPVEHIHHYHDPYYYPIPMAGQEQEHIHYPRPMTGQEHEHIHYPRPVTGQEQEPIHHHDYDYSGMDSGSGVQMDELSMIVGQGSNSTPASSAAIDSLRTVEIKKKHVRSDALCPVCQEKFKLGMKAKRMPCKHMYHSGCIRRWLAENNSCPVCRHELPTQP